MPDNSTFVKGFDPADDRGSLITALCATLLPLTTFIVGLRFYARITSHNLGADDWVTLCSLALMFITSLVQFGEVHYGMGKHSVFVSPDDAKMYGRVFYVDVIFYNCALASIKIQVLLQYFRLFNVDRAMRRVLLIVTVAVSIWSAFTILSAIISCVPLEAFWDQSVKGTCFPIVYMAYTHAAGHIVTDLVIFALPIRLLWKLQMPRSQRLSLLAIFCFGFFTCCISGIRVGWINIDRGGTQDSMYYNVETAGWSIGELACAMIVTCLPTLRPLIFKIRGGESQRSGPKKYNYYSSAVQTIGGSGGKGSKGSKGASFGSGGRSFGSRRQETGLDSVVELTGRDDVEMGYGVNSSPIEKMRTQSRDEVEEPVSPFPIQHPGQEVMARGLGVRGYSYATVGTTPSVSVPQVKTRTCTCTCHHGSNGIHVQRDVTQQTRTFKQ